MVRVMFEELTTVVAMFVSGTMVPPTTIPTFVFCVGSVLGTKPVPIRETVNVWPDAAVGRLAGEIAVTVAPADSTVTLKEMTIEDEGFPQERVTVPVRTLPGCAAAKIRGLKVTGIEVPKL
jgi:hypothetical protein